MKVDSLQELEAAFSTWRRKKQSRYEKTPLRLLIRAREAAKKHGSTAVVQATGIDRKLLGNTPTDDSAEDTIGDKSTVPEAGFNEGPAFSRLSLSAPMPPSAQPLIEIETAAGMKLRVFEQTPEILSLLSAACELGRRR